MSEPSRGHKAASENHKAEEWEHLAHYAHEAHLAAEGLEFLVDQLHEGAEFVRHGQAAAKMLRTHSQMAYDLRRMARGIRKLQNVAREGGARGIKAAQQLPKARLALTNAQAAFAAERPATSAANVVVQGFQRMRDTTKGAAIIKLGEASQKLEVALTESAVGSKLLAGGRVIVSKPFVNGLIVVGTAAEGVASYTDSTAVTVGGKATNAALGAGGGALTMLNPYVAVADFAAPKGYKLSEIYHGGAGAVTAIGEGFWKGDTTAMDDFHKRSMEGHYGKVIQAASAAGEYWAEKGVAGGLKEFADALQWWLNL